MPKTLLLVLLSIFLVSCSDEHEEPAPDATPVLSKDSKEKGNPTSYVLRKDSLRILDIGNSYTEDVTAFLPQVVKANGVDVSTVALYRAVRGMGSFKTWYDCYHDNDNVVYKIVKVLGGIDVNALTGDFGPGDGGAFRELLQKNKWDVIMLHQASTYAPYYDEWFTQGNGGYLAELLSLLKELQPQALIGFYVVHSYWSDYASNKEHSSFARWQLTVNSVDMLVEKGLCDIVMPYGTAIENLRLSSFNNDYDLTRDGTHLEYGLARYAAACCYYETIFEPRYGVSMVGQTFHWDGQQLNSPYPIISLNDSTSTIAQKAAAMAVADWRNCCSPKTAVPLLSQ